MDAEIVRLDPSDFWRVQVDAPWLRLLGTTQRPLGTLKRPVDTLERPLGTTGRPLGNLKRPLGTTRRPLDAPERPLGTTQRAVDTPNRNVTFVRIVAEVILVAFSAYNLLRRMAACVYEQISDCVAPRCCWP